MYEDKAINFMRQKCIKNLLKEQNTKEKKKQQNIVYIENNNRHESK